MQGLDPREHLFVALKTLSSWGCYTASTMNQLVGAQQFRSHLRFALSMPHALSACFPSGKFDYALPQQYPPQPRIAHAEAKYEYVTGSNFDFPTNIVPRTSMIVLIVLLKG